MLPKVIDALLARLVHEIRRVVERFVLAPDCEHVERRHGALDVEQSRTTGFGSTLVAAHECFDVKPAGSTEFDSCMAQAVEFTFDFVDIALAGASRPAMVDSVRGILFDRRSVEFRE